MEMAKIWPDAMREEESEEMCNLVFEEEICPRGFDARACIFPSSPRARTDIVRVWRKLGKRLRRGVEIERGEWVPLLLLIEGGGLGGGFGSGQCVCAWNAKRSGKLPVKGPIATIDTSTSTTSHSNQRSIILCI